MVEISFLAYALHQVVINCFLRIQISMLNLSNSQGFIRIFNLRYFINAIVEAVQKDAFNKVNNVEFHLLDYFQCGYFFENCSSERKFVCFHLYLQCRVTQLIYPLDESQAARIVHIYVITSLYSTVNHEASPSSSCAETNN